MKQLLDQLATEYEFLVNNRTKLENDCTKLKDYIDSQITQIQSLNNDFEKLRQEFLKRGGTQLMKQVQDPAPTEAEQHAEEEQTTQDWELITLAAPENILKPYIISLIAEILDISVICSTSFSPNGTFIAIGSDKTIRVYNIEKDTFQFQETIETNETDPSISHIRSISWIGNDKIIVCHGGDSHIRVYDIYEKKLCNDFTTGEGGVFQVLVSNNNKYISAITGDGSLVIFSMDDFTEIARMKRTAVESDEEVIAVSMAISLDDKIIAVGYSDYHIVLWDVETHQQLLDNKCHSDGIQAIKFIPNSNRLATASLDFTIKIWEMNKTDDGKIDFQMWKSIDGHENFVLTLAVDAKGEWLLSGSKDMSARLIDLKTGEMIYNIKGHANSIISVDFNKAGNLFCTGSGDKSVKIWSFTPEETGEI
ncbi:Transcriptional repressor tup11-related protein [Histomonas meleagridis]|uniref:Transcriptional repressor tup11-related protein n=1 Tax=Histomonas meleagridis TaxID=135588 RepID=UPI003559C40A|nr:Transcriptional repressor tup11-related protein [Histomonas meleagridis]KAH0796137.1 Transcriptional repressor tup11-related protein [Histomonas meleagridis]